VPCVFSLPRRPPFLQLFDHPHPPRRAIAHAGLTTNNASPAAPVIAAAAHSSAGTVVPLLPPRCRPSPQLNSSLERIWKLEAPLHRSVLRIRIPSQVGRPRSLRVAFSFRSRRVAAAHHSSLAGLVRFAAFERGAAAAALEEGWYDAPPSGMHQW